MILTIVSFCVVYHQDIKIEKAWFLGGMDLLKLMYYKNNLENAISQVSTEAAEGMHV